MPRICLQPVNACYTDFLIMSHGGHNFCQEVHCCQKPLDHMHATSGPILSFGLPSQSKVLPEHFLILRRFGVGEMARQLRALATFPKDPVWIPSTHIVFTATCDSSSRVSNTLFWPSGALHTRGTQTNIQANTYTHKKNFKILNVFDIMQKEGECYLCGPS